VPSNDAETPLSDLLSQKHWECSLQDLWFNHSTRQKRSPKVLTSQDRKMKCLIPRSHKFWTSFPQSPLGNWDGGPWRELPTTGHRVHYSTVAADSQVVKCIRFGHRQVIHIPFKHCKHPSTRLVDKDSKNPYCPAQVIPREYDLITRYINPSVQTKLVSKLGHTRLSFSELLSTPCNGYSMTITLLEARQYKPWPILNTVSQQASS